jgi:hypothetical protein
VSASFDDLAEPLRSAVKALVADAARSGVTVTASSTRRTYAQQVALRMSNGCPDVHTSPASSCKVPTAIPGTSKHESGLAVDFTNTDKIIGAVAERAAKYQIHRTVPGERWHYEHRSTSGRTASDAGAGDGGWDPSDDGGGGLGINLGGGPIVAAFSMFSSGEFWLRVLAVVAGAVLVVVGLGLIGIDLGGLGLAGKVPS